LLLTGSPVNHGDLWAAGELVVVLPLTYKKRNVMSDPKKIIDAKNDSDGNVAAVKLEGNKSFTSIEVAVRMAEKGKVDAVPVHPKTGKPHLRSKPDGKKDNNLDSMAED